MGYRYLTAGSPMTFFSPQKSWTDDFNDLVSIEFYNASNVYTIRRESFFSSGSYIDIDVRIDSAIDNATGDKLGDDFKVLIFKDDTYLPNKGDKFYFDNNYWIVTNTGNIKMTGISCTIRRCNNVLRWTDTDGNYFAEHCIIEYAMSTTRNRVRSDPMIPDGTIKVYAQLNTQVRTLRENRRFLFGNSDQWVCYKVYGGGIGNFLNNNTTDNNSAHIIEFDMGKDMVNYDTDDVVNGVADYYKQAGDQSSINNIRISPDQTYITAGSTVTYTCYLYNANTKLDNTFTFTISGSSTVPSSYYILTTIDGNTFTIENISKYLEDSLIVTCTSGLYSRDFRIDLRGAW